MTDRIEVQVVDFFSGCGGMSHGFASASTTNVSYRLAAAVDTDKHANATYQRMLGIEPVRADVRTLALSASDPEELRRSVGLNSDGPLVVIGCAPCQGFSSHRKKDTRLDVRNSLLPAFGKIAVALRPDVVVMENVPEMLREQHWAHFAQWRQTLEAVGYTVRVQIHNLATFGVPQERFRALVIAARDWKTFAMPAPTHTPSEFVTVRDAIAHLPPLEAGSIDPQDAMHQTSRHRQETITRIMMVPPDGGSRKSLPSGAVPGCLRIVDGFRDVYGRLTWEKPAVAITARCRTPSCGRFTHPEQHRGLSVREAALLQGFPPGFQFEGPFDDKFKQIGNAVSPIFAQAVARHLDHEWLKEHDTRRCDVDTQHDVTKPFRKSFSSSIAGLKRRARTHEQNNPYRIA